MILFAKRLFPLLLLVWQCQAQEPTGTPATENVTATAAPTVTEREWGGCIDPSDPTALVTLGQKTTICLVLADGADWGVTRSYLRLSIQPIADQYSRYHVPYSFNELFVDGSLNKATNTFLGNLTVHAESQTSLSFQKRYYDGFEKIFPHLTAIVNVVEGVVTGITWDDAGVFCGKSESEPNTFDFAGNLATEQEAEQPVRGCYLDFDECKTWHAAGRTDCDMILYTVWTGTDANGRSFLSSGYRFSAFPAQELGDRFSQNLPSLPSVLGGE